MCAAGTGSDGLPLDLSGVGRRKAVWQFGSDSIDCQMGYNEAFGSTGVKMNTPSPGANVFSGAQLEAYIVSYGSRHTFTSSFRYGHASPVAALSRRTNQCTSNGAILCLRSASLSGGVTAAITLSMMDMISPEVG